MSDADDERLRATFEVYQDDSDEWRWRLRHRNGNIVADSAEGYSSRSAAIDGLYAVRPDTPTAHIEVEGTGDDGGDSG